MNRKSIRGEVTCALAAIEQADDNAFDALARVFKRKFKLRVLDEHMQVVWAEGEDGMELFWRQLLAVLKKKQVTFWIEGTDARGRRAVAPVRLAA
jgi:hypothetical protein